MSAPPTSSPKFQPCPFEIADNVLAASLVDVSHNITALCPCSSAYLVIKLANIVEDSVSCDVGVKVLSSSNVGVVASLGDVFRAMTAVRLREQGMEQRETYLVMPNLSLSSTLRTPCPSLPR